MEIQFTGKRSQNDETHGIMFEAIVDGELVQCEVSTEALLLINPEKTLGDAQNEFTSYLKLIEVVAKKKILDQETVDGKIYIHAEDIKQYAP